MWLINQTEKEKCYITMIVLERGLMEINNKKSRVTSVFVSWFKGGSITVQDETQNVTVHFNSIEELDKFTEQLGVLRDMWEKKNGNTDIDKR